MIVAILVICFVLVLRHLDRKNRERDSLKSGAVAAVSADYVAIKKALGDLSDRLSRIEAEYQELEEKELELAQTAGGAR